MNVSVIVSRVIADLRSGLVSWWLNGLIASPLCPRDVRRAVWRLAGIDVGTANIWPGVTVVGRQLKVGYGVMINSGCYLDATGGIEIGDSVALGQGVKVITTSHHIGGPEQRAGELFKSSVRIGSGAWIGAGAVILPGVRIGKGSIVAAAATVTQDVEAGCLFGGTPARLLRRLS